jgi:hypothetical protein
VAVDYFGSLMLEFNLAAKSQMAGLDNRHLREFDSFMPIPVLYHIVDFVPIQLDGGRDMVWDLMIFPAKNFDHYRFAVLYSAQENVGFSNN